MIYQMSQRSPFKPISFVSEAAVLSFITPNMYKILPKTHTDGSEFPISESTSRATIPLEFLYGFWGLEAAFGRVDGVVKTATGYCGGALKKPSYKEVCEGRTGHTEAVKVMYDKRKISYKSLCDAFWEAHDPTNKEFLNFGLSTHHRSAIFYVNEEQKKQAQESKIRRQMKLNRRIVTKIIALDSEFFVAENLHQKYYLQKSYRVCESLSLRSTEQFVESNIACKLNGILVMEARVIIDELTTFLGSHKVSSQTKLACGEIIEDLRRNDGERILKFCED
ncbi:peptide methionine sulfoxide reductase MsrA-like isoform X2 [Vitis riparia]|uniref:peptide methionine sulfoxide reductase MsrA-like isoform X2 n=1 Tax=Vitis riparia TaxID=96939 RepID=UPI00155ACCA9|nr:peptide methionine sulfoxide reductase MsrA-like isoform X2 [Vitis riparia]